MLFIGREKELEILAALREKKTSSLVGHTLNLHMIMAPFKFSQEKASMGDHYAKIYFATLFCHSV